MAEKKKHNKVMLINVTHSEESRVAILNDGIIDAFEIETFDHRSTKGNIYRGRIETVHQGLQACFVDIGDERAGFLPLDEVNFRVHPARKEAAKGRIDNHLQRGQELLVQVVRDAYGTKPPTLSTYFSLPGRYLVLTPHQDSQGISRKLNDKDRDKLRAVLDSLPRPEGFGVIARTAGASATKLDVSRDLKYLLRLWEKIDAASHIRAPKLIYQERSLVIRTIRDLYSPDISEILVDDEDAYREIQQFFDVVLPHKKKAVTFYQGDRPIFNKHNLEEQIESIFRRRVPLPSGGALVFDTTEALTSVDVNSGRMKQEGHIEDTATRANLEAAEVIGRQLRLRDLGGLVVIDFIDMRSAKNIRQVEKVMKASLKQDKARHDMTRISRLGLMEISRQRINPNKSSLRYTDCPVCDGTGSVKTIEAAALQTLRRLQTRVVRGDLENIEVTLSPEVASYVLNQKRAELQEWERRYRTMIIVKSDAEFGRDSCEIQANARPKGASSSPVLDAPVHDEIHAELEVEPDDLAEAAEVEAGEGGEDAGSAEAKPAKKRRRRRRRRKSKAKSAEGDDGSAEQGESLAEEEDSHQGAESEEPAEQGAAAGETAAEDTAAEAAATDENGDELPKKKRRRRRRRRRKPKTATEEGEGETAGSDEEHPAEVAAAQSVEVAAAQPVEVAAAQPVDPDLPPLAAPLDDTTEYEDGAAPRAQWWKQLVEAS